MIVLKAPTYYRKKKIEDLTSGAHLIRFTQDAKGNYIVGTQILKDPNFKHLKSEFEHLLEIEFEPVTTEI